MIFLIFKGSWQVVKHCTWSSNINQLIIKSINLFNLIPLMIYIWANLLGNLIGHTYKNHLLEIKMRWLIKCDVIVNKF
jgi:hypothetical protein